MSGHGLRAAGSRQRRTDSASPFLARSPDHVFGHARALPVGTLPAIFLAPIGQSPQVPGNCLPGMRRPLNCCEKLWVEGVLEIVRRNPERPWRGREFLV